MAEFIEITVFLKQPQNDDDSGAVPVCINPKAVAWFHRSSESPRRTIVHFVDGKRIIANMEYPDLMYKLGLLDKPPAF